MCAVLAERTGIVATAAARIVPDGSRLTANHLQRWGSCITPAYVLIERNVALTSSEIAAWAQAIGSLFAIIAAFIISAKQFRDATSLQREAARTDRRRRFEALIGLVEAAIEDFTDTLNALLSSEPEKQA